MNTPKPLSLLALFTIPLLGACAAEGPLATEEGAAVAEARVSPNPATRTYEFTITNHTTGQPFTPPLVATHHGKVNVFDVGAPASFGVKEIAENGNLGPLNTALMNDGDVSNVKIVLASGPGPLMPGASVTFEIDAEPRAKFFSIVSMLICTNDGFTGADARRLPTVVGQTTSGQSNAYDAGTEITTEDYSDMVPPCAPLTGQVTAKMGTGMSNPVLAENGVISMHQGIRGIADLLPGLHGFTSPVATISVTRTR